MLTEGFVDFVATDCHDMPGREPKMTMARDIMIGLIGEEKTYRILVENPNMIIKE